MRGKRLYLVEAYLNDGTKVSTTYLSEQKMSSMDNKIEGVRALEKIYGDNVKAGTYNFSYALTSLSRK